MIVGVFANGSGYRGPITSRVILKTQKWYLMPLCEFKRSNEDLKTEMFNLGKYFYQQDYPLKTYFFNIYIYIYIYIYI